MIIKNYFEETIKISVESRNNKDFKSQRCNVYTELINKTALISNDDKGMHSSDLIETYAYRTSKDLIWKKKINVII